MSDDELAQRSTGERDGDRLTWRGRAQGWVPAGVAGLGAAVTGVWTVFGVADAAQRFPLGIAAVFLTVTFVWASAVAHRVDVAKRRALAEQGRRRKEAEAEEARLRQQAEAEEARRRKIASLLEWVDDDGRPPRLSQVDDHDLGVTPTRYSKEGNAPYVQRRLTDQKLRQAMSERGVPHPFVLVVGQQKAGKSRTTVEALRFVFGQADPRIVIPRTVGAVDELVSLDPPVFTDSETAVVWLDDLTIAELNELSGQPLARLRAKAVVIGTMASGRLAELQRSRDTAPSAWRTLSAAEQIPLDFKLTDLEHANAARHYPDEEISASIGETLVGAPALLDLYLHGHEHSATGAAGCAIVRAAVDCRRAGLDRRVTASELSHLFGLYLHQTHPHLDPVAARFDEGLAWALEPVTSKVALLRKELRHGEVATYEVVDLLVGHDDGAADAQPARAIPADIWLALLDLVSDEDAVDLGLSAFVKGEADVAITIFTRCTESSDHVVAGFAQLNLGRLLQERDPDAAFAAYEMAVRCRDPEVKSQALIELGTVLASSNKAEAERYLRQAVSIEGAYWTPVAHLALGRLLADDDPEAARTEFRAALDSGLVEAASPAAFRLGQLTERDDPDAAIEAYQQAIAFDQPLISAEAWLALGALYERLNAKSAAIDAYRTAATSYLDNPDVVARAAYRLAAIVTAKDAAGREIRDAQGAPSDASAGGSGAVVPDQELVTQLLDQMELKWVVDDEGDLVAPWESFRTYFMFRGEGEQQVYSVRTFYDRPHADADRALLVDATDDWNRRTLWPKVYTHEHDDGTLRLVGETQMLIGAGVGLEHFVSSTVSWVRAAVEFDKWLVEALSLTAVEVSDEIAASDDSAS